MAVNPVEDGQIQSFARPGGNVTGLASSAGDAVAIKESPKVALI